MWVQVPPAWRQKCGASLLTKCPFCRCHPWWHFCQLAWGAASPFRGAGTHMQRGSSLVHFPDELHMQSSEPRPRHYCHWGWTMLSCGGCPEHGRMFRSIPGLCLLHARGAHPVMAIKVSPALPMSPVVVGGTVTPF